MTLSSAVLGLIALTALLLPACVEGESARSTVVAQEQRTTGISQRELLKAQPIPSLTYSLDRDTLIQVYQLRNEARNTWSVVISDTGVPIWSCPSVGFPVPGGTQLTNPQQVSGGAAVIAQAEPNGLYTDPSTNSTWVLCVRQNGDVVPVYAESKVLAFPFPVSVQNGRIVEDVKGASTAKLKVQDPAKAQVQAATTGTPTP